MHLAANSRLDRAHDRIEETFNFTPIEMRILGSNAFNNSDLRWGESKHMGIQDVLLTPTPRNPCPVMRRRSRADQILGCEKLKKSEQGTSIRPRNRMGGRANEGGGAIDEAAKPRSVIALRLD
jgi:hypothetical protein